MEDQILRSEERQDVLQNENDWQEYEETMRDQALEGINFLNKGKRNNPESHLNYWYEKITQLIIRISNALPFKRESIAAPEPWKMGM